MGKIGRPRLDDEEPLARMADEIFKEPTLTRTEAFRRIRGTYGKNPKEQSLQAECKRLVKRFNERKDQLLADAEQRFYPTERGRSPIVITIPRFAFVERVQVAFGGLSDLSQMRLQANSDTCKSFKRLSQGVSPAGNRVFKVMEELTRPTREVADIFLRMQSNSDTYKSFKRLSQGVSPAGNRVFKVMEELTRPTRKVADIFLRMQKQFKPIQCPHFKGMESAIKMQTLIPDIRVKRYDL